MDTYATWGYNQILHVKAAAASNRPCEATLNIIEQHVKNIFNQHKEIYLWTVASELLETKLVDIESQCKQNLTFIKELSIAFWKCEVIYKKSNNNIVKPIKVSV